MAQKVPEYRERGDSDVIPPIQIAPGDKYQLTLWVDLEHCTGCKACTIQCKAENNTPLGVDYNRVIYVETGKYPKNKMYFVPMPCMHCGKPPCKAACPVNAISKRDKDGVVQFDTDKCIGCRYCIWACPFGAPQFNAEKKVAEKCTLCTHRTTDADGDLTGLKPACVDTCIGRARFFGDMGSLANVKKNKRAMRVGEGVAPSVLYTPP
ncbi:MAG: 4Fe-4S dicluster domain-containing protein [Candidatus Hydrothermarchaeales archaeon]